MLFMPVDIIHMANEIMKEVKCFFLTTTTKKKKKRIEEEDTTKHCKVNPCMGRFHSRPQHFPS
jgi:hypothetical protein